MNIPSFGAATPGVFNKCIAQGQGPTSCLSYDITVIQWITSCHK